MAINSKDLLKTGDFVTRFYSATAVVASGSSGTLFALTPPQGQRVRIDALVSDDAVVDGITIAVGGNAVVLSRSLANASAEITGEFVVNGSVGGQGRVSGGHITGGVDEEIVMTKDSGSTNTEIRYSYQFGE